MPKKPEPEKVQCTFFNWPIYQRPNGVWYADGRSNGAATKRTSLGTKKRSEALFNLSHLDRIRAEELGLTPRTTDEKRHRTLSIADGRTLFDEHAARPRMVGGTKPNTQKRYRSILDKFVDFLGVKKIADWNQITEKTLADYASHLTEREYAYKTVYGELNTIKTVFRWLCTEGHIAREPLNLKLRKAECQRPYCYTVAEVEAMLNHCQENDLDWLYGVIIALACTGLRISELASLKHSDIRFDERTFSIMDESGYTDQGVERRSTKSSRSRHIPINATLLRVLQSLPKTSQYVFLGPSGGRLKPDTVRNILVREVIEPLTTTFPKTYPGEKSFEDGRLHSFRHYFCSVCANNSVPERIVMEWLGHAESEMVGHYYHLTDDESRRRMDQLNPLGNHAGRSGSDDKQNFSGGDTEPEAS